MPYSPELDHLFDSPMSALDRDQYDRPLLVPTPALDANPYLLNRISKKQPDGRRPDGKLPYTRASSMSNFVSDHTALETWRMRSLTYGLGQREDLAARAASLPPVISNLRDKETLTKAEVEQDRNTNALLDQIAEEAMVYANRDYKANYGTAIHGFTDPGPHGDVPARMQADVAAWERLTARWEFLGTELFVANDTYQSAGTFDHLVRIPSRPDLGALVVDKKTGILHFDQHAVQLAVYAGGDLYDVDTDQRTAMPDDLNTEWGLIVHIPMGRGVAVPYLVNLHKGRNACRIAVEVRSYRRDNELAEQVDFVQEERIHVGGLLAVADSRETMLAIQREYKDIWHDDLTAVAKQRLAEIGEKHLTSA